MRLSCNPNSLIALLVGVLLLGGCGHSHSSNFFGIVSAKRPQWSPTQPTLLFSCAFSQDLNGDALYELCITDSDRKSVQRFLPGISAWNGHEPQWSHDGKKITLGHPEGGVVIYDLLTAGHRITAKTHHCSEPQWSSDDTRIVCSTTLGEQTSIMIITVDTGDFEFLPLRGGNFSPQWLYGGAALVYKKSLEANPEQIDLYQVDLQTMAEQRVANDISAFSVSHDGERIALRQRGDWQIEIVDVRNNLRRHLFADQMGCLIHETLHFQWSPNDAHIVFAASVFERSKLRGQLYSVDVATGLAFQQTIFNDVSAFTISPPSWSFNGQFIAVSFSRANDGDFNELSITSYSEEIPINTDCQ